MTTLVVPASSYHVDTGTLTSPESAYAVDADGQFADLAGIAEFIFSVSAEDLPDDSDIVAMRTVVRAGDVAYQVGPVAWTDDGWGMAGPQRGISPGAIGDVSIAVEPLQDVATIRAGHVGVSLFPDDLISGAHLLIDYARLEIDIPGPPVAQFNVYPMFFDFDFSDATTGIPDVASWSWDFGDGSVSADQSPEHTYAAPGTYSVSLTVDNGYGTDTATATVTATLPPNPFDDRGAFHGWDVSSYSDVITYMATAPEWRFSSNPAVAIAEAVARAAGAVSGTTNDALFWAFVAQSLCDLAGVPYGAVLEDLIRGFNL